MTLTPQYFAAYDIESCFFEFYVNKTYQTDGTIDYRYDKNDFFLTHHPIVDKENGHSGKAVFNAHGKWVIEDTETILYKYPNTEVVSSIGIHCGLMLEPEACVFPIDPAIRDIDIIGAKDLYPNPTNTGWLFKHAEREDHHDREVLTEAIIVAVFEPEVTDKNVRVLSAIVNGRQSNQQLGELNNYNTLIEFRKDVLKYAIAQERVMYIGQHVHVPDENHLSRMALKAVNGVKQIWASTKSSELDGMSAELNRIISRLQHRHGYQTRWAKAAAKKKAAASSESASDSESQE